MMKGSGATWRTQMGNIYGARRRNTAWRPELADREEALSIDGVIFMVAIGPGGMVWRV